MAKRTFRFNKLVRDEIASHILANGGEVNSRSLTDTEMVIALKQKLIEEAKELYSASKKDDLVSEMADIAEIKQAIQEITAISEEEIISARAMKNKKNGAFNKRIFIENVTFPDDPVKYPWLKYYLDHPDQYPEVTI